MTKKYSTPQIEFLVANYLKTALRIKGNQREALDYLISQFIYLLANAPKTTQDEAIKGFEMHTKEL
jgi:hypothetical protein